jgi:hypothetical protein
MADIIIIDKCGVVSRIWPPKVAGIYAIFYKEQLLYIGQSQNIRQRIKEHNYREWLEFPETILLCFENKDRFNDEKILIAKCKPLLNGNGGWLNSCVIREAKGEPIVAKRYLNGNITNEADAKKEFEDYMKEIIDYSYPTLKNGKDAQ